MRAAVDWIRDENDYHLNEGQRQALSLAKQRAADHELEPSLRCAQRQRTRLPTMPD
jgi:hypothetical protein